MGQCNERSLYLSFTPMHGPFCWLALIQLHVRVIRAAFRCIAAVIIQHDKHDETLHLRGASIIARCHYKSLFARFTHGGYTSLQPSENIT